MWKNAFLRMNVKNIICLVMMGLVISLFQGPLLVKATSVEPKTVKIGYYENEIFQEGASNGAVKSGYAYEYYMKLSEYTSWKYEYVYGSFNDLYQQLIDGEIDMMAGLAYREERTEFISYPELPMGSESYNLIKRVGDDTISDLASISGRNIGVLDSAVADSLEEYLLNHSISANITRYSDATKMSEAFEAGDVDLLAVEGEGTNKRSGYESIMAFAITDYYVCVNNSRQDLLDELNIAQTYMLNDEPYYQSALSSKYHGTSVSATALSPLERAWIDEHDTINVGYLNNYLPYSDTTVAGNATGVVKELMPNIFHLLGLDNLKINYVGYDTYDAMISAINADEVDVVFTVGGGIYFSEQNGIHQTGTLVSASTELVYKDVVVNPDTATFAINENNNLQYYYVRTYYPNAEIIYYDGIERCLDAVVAKEADCAILDGLRASELLKNFKYKNLFSRQLSGRDDRCLGVKIGNDGLLRLLNRGVQLLEDDYVDNNAYKYNKGLYISSFSNWIYNHLIVIMLSIAVFIVAIIVFQIIRLKKLHLRIEGLTNSNRNQIILLNSIATSINEPINEIYGISSAISNSLDDEKLVGDGLEAIATKSGNIKAVSDMILDISLLDRGKVILENDKVNIVDLVKDVESLFMAKAEKNNINLSLILGEIKNKSLIIDNKRMKQVLYVVLDNAIKYSPSGSQVTLKAIEEPSKNVSLARMVFTVTDNGTGMSDKFKKIAFDAFARGDNAADTEGVGLGLTIAKRLIDLMGGTITIESQTNQGCEVKITVECKINYS